MALKYSRQRQVIRDYLMSTKEHPTAETVYAHVRKKYPNISLGTVYRNLSLLAELGDIRRLRMGDGVDRFDADTSAHYHVVCTECGGVSDLKMEPISRITELADRNYPGRIEGHITYFYGVCAGCCGKNREKRA